MTLDPALKDSYGIKLKKSLTRLQTAFQKCGAITLSNDLDDDVLEAFEGLTARFARTADIFLNRYLRACVILEDPAFRGTFKDFLNQAEKQGIIDTVTSWMAVRELRNRIAHEYEEEALKDLFLATLAETPRLLALQSLLK